MPLAPTKLMAQRAQVTSSLAVGGGYDGVSEAAARIRVGHRANVKTFDQAYAVLIELGYDEQEAKSLITSAKRSRE